MRVTAKETQRLADVVAGGDLRSALEALRDRLADEVERVAEDGFCPVCKRGSSSVAPLAKQLRDVLVQLDSLAKPVGSKTDELKKRRADRQAGVAKRAAGSAVKRAGRG